MGGRGEVGGGGEVGVDGFEGGRKNEEFGAVTLFAISGLAGS